MAARLIRKCGLLSVTQINRQSLSQFRSSSCIERLPQHPIKPQISIFQPARTMAGHNKWSNIRHIKAAKDAQKDKVASMMYRKIRHAARVGGLDPKINKELAKAIDEAKKKNVPSANINEQLKKLAKSKDAGAMHTVEAKGVGNCCMIIEVFTEKLHKTRQELTSIMRKVGGSIGTGGSSSYAFDQKYLVTLARSEEGVQLTLDDALEHAIEIGAEDVQEAIDSDGNPAIQFICDPGDVKDVMKNMEAAKLSVESSKLGYVAHTFVTLTPEHQPMAEKMFDLLEDHENVVEIYDNIQQEEAA